MLAEWGMVLSPSRLSFCLFCRLLVLGFLLLGGDMSSVFAAETEPTLVFRTGAHATFDRLVFDAPRGFGYTIRRHGGEVALLFNKPATVTLRPTVSLTRARAFEKGHATKDGVSRLAVRFAVNPKATVKDFMSGTTIVVDIYGPPVASNAALAPEPAAPEKPTQPPEPPKKEEPKPAPPPPRRRN
jgi:hypothetical protein